MAVVAPNKRVVVTEQQLQAWLNAKLNDPRWVSEMKSRSQEAVAQMRARGFLPQSK